MKSSALSGKGMTVRKTNTLLLELALILTAAAGLSACERRVDYCSCHYTPWPVEEHELFGLTQEEIKAKYKLSSPIDGDTTLGSFNVQYDDRRKVCAVRRFFIGCKATYYGPWLQSKKEALNYSINGLRQYNDEISIAKRSALESMLAKLSKLPENTSAKPAKTKKTSDKL